jgi:hypothetical protein
MRVGKKREKEECLRVINYLLLNNKLRGNESGSTKSFQLRASESFFPDETGGGAVREVRDLERLVVCR